MLFKSAFSLLKIHFVIAWLILLFQAVISFAGNSEHHKQNGKGARMGAFFMAVFVKKYDRGAARPPFHAVCWYSPLMGRDALL